MRYTSCILLTGCLVFTTAAIAQERSATANTDVQASWSSLKVITDTALSTAKGVQANLDKVKADMTYCASDNSLYAPNSPAANSHGCVVNPLKKTVEDMQADVTALKGRMDIAEGKINTLETNLQKLSDALGKLDSREAQHNTDLSNRIAKVAADLAALDTREAGHNTATNGRVDSTNLNLSNLDAREKSDNTATNGRITTTNTNLGKLDTRESNDNTNINNRADNIRSDLTTVSDREKQDNTATNARVDKVIKDVADLTDYAHKVNDKVNAQTDRIDNIILCMKSGKLYNETTDKCVLAADDGSTASDLRWGQGVTQSKVKNYGSSRMQDTCGGKGPGMKCSTKGDTCTNVISNEDYDSTPHDNWGATQYIVYYTVMTCQ